jgi:Putative Ig domain
VANHTITVDGVAMGTSDASGNFKIQSSSFSAPADCTVDVNDGSTTPASARLSGCTVQVTTTTTTITPTPVTTAPPPPPSSGLRITDGTLPNANVGTSYAAFIGACCGQGTPYRWSLVAGRVPSGLTFAGDSLRLTQSTGVTGTPTTVQTTTFTVQVRDGAGSTATASFSLTVDPARPLVITNQSDQLAPGAVGVPYAIGVFSDGGVPPYLWSVALGPLPPGLSLTASPGRITGTPTTAGTFAFTLRVTDSAAHQATRTFTIAVAP